ncbi:bifunctional riboflavin kinase/FAD synthetase [Thiomicrospira sp. WB1]|uniref:bifunctional riboflavin kinase/FAD synthetase n=1 Tax=Thiomicrospira sp. WB1 TaxID=1685380 RepID=UPI00074A9151|nr:bifunctional riboflavin kinase/FAD synthetase [Thiomicrospira sp. WB1]KUJ72654.1 bifunctional riboflavin kinase/FMN adenylyltransferase [Thiomicrospira sp. WB1]
MQLILGRHNLTCPPPELQQALADGSVVTIGNFDGIHLGHQAILDQVAALAKSSGLPSVVMVFEPLPAEFFAPESAPVRLMNLREKVRAFQRTDIDYVLVIRFDAAFAALRAQTFVDTILHRQLNVRHLVVGDDFRFGAERKGDFNFLTLQGRALGFSVSEMTTYELHGRRVSSTLVRQALEDNNLTLARELLGGAFCFHGRVIHGKKLGRQLGFRTLNLNPKRMRMPLIGVYTVYVHGLSNGPQPGIANIGIRPTVKGERPSIEVHLFDWDRDVYGAHVRVEIDQFVRAEQAFASLDALKQQITQDVARARRLLAL